MGWRDASGNAVTTALFSSSLSSYLRKCAGGFAPTAAKHLEAAAAGYARIAALLRPSILGEGSPKYEDFVGDLPAQGAHAGAVLVPVRTELAMAADEMEAAVDAAA